MGWSGKQNGELLRLAADSFDVLLTADRNLKHQQNLTTLPISIVVLVVPTNRIESLQVLVPELLQLLSGRNNRTDESRLPFMTQAQPIAVKASRA
jgi:hypothetical protein